MMEYCQRESLEGIRGILNLGETLRCVGEQISQAEVDGRWRGTQWVRGDHVG